MRHDSIDLTVKFILASKNLCNLMSILPICFFVGCAPSEDRHIMVKNSLNSGRMFETVRIPIDSLGFAHSEKILPLVIKDITSGEPIVSQIVDVDGDGEPDTILFQPELKPREEKTFLVVKSVEPMGETVENSCFSRFVPERTDDFAWENDKVAFRTFGPTAQQMAEQGVKGGTLTSGIDAWLKRVEYPIIDKWYEKYTSNTGTYHEDTGEGLDNFHVGKSRGVGGIAIKKDTLYHTSKNFVSWKHLYNGPIQTCFVLTYDHWDVEGLKIVEEKRISLDYGSYLSKFEIDIMPVDTVAVGLTLHEKDGVTSVGEHMDWVSYWQPHDDSELGTGIVVPSHKMVGTDYVSTDIRDQSNMYALVTKRNEKIIYYAGFGWKKANHITTKSEWEGYLDKFAEKVNNPLRVEFK